MKRIIIILIMVAMVFSIVACSEDSYTDPETTPETGDEANQEDESQDIEASQLPEKKMLKMSLEGMEEEREAILHESKYGYYIYILNGFSFNETDTGKSFITMDYDNDFSVRIDILPSDINHDEWKETIINDLQEFGEVHQIDPKEHFDPYFHDAYYYYLGSAANKGSVIYMMKEIDEVLFQFRVDMPQKEAAEGAGPSFWAMLKTIIPK